MIYQDIHFSVAPYTYQLHFEHRITYIRGNSGTGKTYLYRLLQDVRRETEYTKIRLFNLESEFFEENLQKCREQFIVIDHGDLLLHEKEKEFINFESSNQYLLMMRCCDGIWGGRNSFTTLEERDHVIFLKSIWRTI